MHTYNSSIWKSEVGGFWILDYNETPPHINNAKTWIQEIHRQSTQHHYPHNKDWFFSGKTQFYLPLSSFILEILLAYNNCNDLFLWHILTCIQHTLITATAYLLPPNPWSVYRLHVTFDNGLSPIPIISNTFMIICVLSLKERNCGRC